MRNNKGITLISLVSSIILLLILASTTIATSMNAYKQMKFEGAKSELEEVQKMVYKIASDYETYKSEKGGTPSYEQYFEERYNVSDFSGNLLSKSENLNKASALISSRENKEDKLSPQDEKMFYFDEKDLLQYFGLKGIDPVVVNFNNKKVYSVNGIKDSDNNTEIYYTPTDWNSKVVNSSGDSYTATITATKVQKVGSNQFEVKLVFNKEITSKISEVYYKVGSGSFMKTNNFRTFIGTIGTEAGKTVVRVIVTGSNGSYTFDVYDEFKNLFEGTVTLN